MKSIEFIIHEKNRADDIHFLMAIDTDSVAIPVEVSRRYFEYVFADMLKRTLDVVFDSDSSNGRTPDLGSANVGSTPTSEAKSFVVGYNRDQRGD